MDVVPFAPDNVVENSQDKYTDIMLKTLNTQFNAYGYRRRNIFCFLKPNLLPDSTLVD